MINNILGLLKLRGLKPCAAGIIVKDKRILLTKRSKLLIEGNKWCLPGGHIKFGEKSERAVRREVKEETGFDVKKTKFLFYHDEIIPGLKTHSVVLVFLIEISGKKKTNFEVSEMKWFNKKEIGMLNMAFTHKEILKRFFNRDY